MAEESQENFSNFNPAFGVEKSEGENQNKPKSKPMNENNSAARRDHLLWSKANLYRNAKL